MSRLKNDSIRSGTSRGDIRLTGAGKAVDEVSTIHTVGGLHPRRLNSGGQRLQHFNQAEHNAYRGPREQVNADTRVDGLNVLDRGEQVPWCAINVEAGETIVVGRRHECIAYLQIRASNGGSIRNESAYGYPRNPMHRAELGDTRDRPNSYHQRLTRERLSKIRSGALSQGSKNNPRLKSVFISPQ